MRSTRQRLKAAARSSPVFIVAQARSGTSILYRLLLEHPSFASPGEPNLSESNIMEVIAHRRSIDDHFPRAFAQLDQAGWRAVARDLRWSEPRRRLATRLPAAALRRVPVWRAAGGARTLRAYLSHAAEARHVQRLVEKTPWHLPWLPHLFAAFPRARALAITREPVAVFASFRRRAKQDQEATWADRSLEDFALSWRAEGEAMLSATRRYRGFAILGYEQLLADPDGVQRALFGWLGEAPLRELPGSRPVNPLAPAADARQLAGPIRATGHDWHEWVTVDEADALEQELGDLSRALHAHHLRSAT